MHNKIRVVRRQVANRRNSTRLARLLTAHKRTHRGPPHRENSTGSIENKKVVEPYMKTVYGTIPQNTTNVTVTSEPDEHEPLLK